MASIHSWKRAGRPLFRLARVFRVSVSSVTGSRVATSSSPPKLPQFSDTLARSASMSGGDTTCSQTRPRSSAMELMRLPYDSSRRSSWHRSREQTVVASSETFIRCVLPNSEKMLFGWSEEIGCLSRSGRLPSMIAGSARSEES
jgi:hypothetical protein